MDDSIKTIPVHLAGYLALLLDGGRSTRAGGDDADRPGNDPTHMSEFYAWRYACR